MSPMIMLTGRTTKTDEVVGLEVGADDYITKPFDSRILAARINAHLRRATLSEAGGGREGILTVGGLQIDRRDGVAYTLRSGKIVRMEYYNDQQQALAAVGLAE